MKRFLIITAVLAVGSVSLGQSGGGFKLGGSTIDGGGGRSAGGEFQLVCVIGQPDAGAIISGGEYSLSGGFLLPAEVGSRVSGWSLY